MEGYITIYLRTIETLLIFLLQTWLKYIFLIPIYLPCPTVTEWESLCWHLKKFLHVIPFCRNAMRYLVSGFATFCSQYTFNYNVYLKLNVVGRIIAFHRKAIPETCAYVRLYSKGELRLQMKLWLLIK